MNLFSLLTFAAFMIYITLGLYVLKMDIKSRPNRVFLLLCLSLAIWALGYTFVYPAPDRERAFMWVHIASIGVYYVPGILLHFVLSLTLPHNKAHRWWLYVIYYLPGLLLHIFSFMYYHPTVSNLTYSPLGWCEIVDPCSFSFWALNLYFLIFLLIGTIRMITWGHKSIRKRQKKQANLIVTSIILTVSSSFLTDSILPALKISTFPSIAPVFFLILAGGLWLSIRKYKLMSLTPEIAADEIISKINELLFLVNSHGQIILSNDKSQEVLEYSSIEMRGNYITDFINMKNFNNRLILDDKFTLNEDFVSDMEFINKSGVNIPVEMSISPIKDKSGETIGMVIVGHDLRILHQLQAMEKEKEYHDLKTRFITTASHEFRTPLSTILLSAETLQNRSMLMNEDKITEYYNRIYKSIDRMKNLMDDVLTLEKSANNTIQAHFEDIDIKSLIDDICDTHMVQNDNIHNIQINYHKSCPSSIYTDPKLLSNIITNLLSNARKYSGQTQPITLIISRVDNNLIIQVKDKGIGIIKADLPRIFNSFHRGKNIGNISGTGLGLVIVKNSLDLLFGTINVDSKEKHGSTFTITLPL